MKILSCFIFLISVMAWAKSSSYYTKKCFTKPCQISGDFDSDGKPDEALLVESKTGKYGIQIKFANGTKKVIGAGSTFGNGGDDFSWMDRWQLEKSKNKKAKGDSLYVAKKESASALIFWNGTALEWLQQGD